MSRPRARTRRKLRRGRPAAALAWLLLAPTLAGAAHAGQWTIELDPLLMDAYGHDQHVLTTSNLVIDVNALMVRDSESAVSLETNSGGAYRGRFQYDQGEWGWGVDYLWFATSQDQRSLSAIGGGPFDFVSFEIAERLYFSAGPDEVLFFDVLEDTDLAIWTADLYARRTLAADDDSSLSLVFGLRVGDFDNDYRAVTGVEGFAFTRQDASSNYSAMYGPMLGLAAQARCGRHGFMGYLSQSVLLGEANLSVRNRDFVGTFGDDDSRVAIDETFGHLEDVAIPISDLRLKWTYQATRRLALGLAAEASTWWDVPVPPGVVPGLGPRLQENTIVFVGFGASLRVTL